MQMNLLIVFTFCLAAHSYAQTDDYPDYRSKKDGFIRIVEKDIRADIASFAIGGLDESVGLNPLHSMGVSGISKNNITFSEKNIQVKIITKPFDPAKHKLSFFDEEKKYLVKIDSKGYYGDYGKVPKTVIDSVIVVVGRDSIFVPPIAFSDLANPILSFTEGNRQKTNNKVYVSADGKKMYIYMLKTEAGGSYEVTWVIQDNKYLKRVVDFGFLK